MIKREEVIEMYNEDNSDPKPKKSDKFILNLIIENIELTDRNITLAYEVKKLKKQVEELKKNKGSHKIGNDNSFNNIYIVLP